MSLTSCESPFGLWLFQPLREMAHSSCTPNPRRALWEGVSTGTKEKAVGGMGSPGLPRWSFQSSSFCGAGLYLLKGRTMPACLFRGRTGCLLRVNFPPVQNHVSNSHPLCLPVSLQLLLCFCQAEEHVCTQHLSLERHFISAVSSPLLYSDKPH